MKKVLLVIAFSFLISNSSLLIVKAQLQGQAKIDSLLKELPKMKNDTNAVNLLSTLSFAMYSINPDKGVEYGEKGLKIAEEINWKAGKAKCYNSLGVIYCFGKSNFPKALEYHFKALKINEALGNKPGIASNLGNIGSVYGSQSDYPKALEYYHKALKINEEAGNKGWISNYLNNIGHIYKSNSNYPKALEYFHKALKINEELGNNSSVAAILVNIGTIYQLQSDYSQALEYYLKALEINEALGEKSATVIGNIGYIYLTLSKDSTIQNSKNKAVLMLNNEINLNKGIEYTKKAINIFSEIGDLQSQSWYLSNLTEAFVLKSDYKKAFETFKEYKDLRDSVFSMDKQKEIANLESKRQLELKEKENQLLIKDNELFNAELKTKSLERNIFIAGVIIFVILFLAALNRYRIKKKLSEDLEIQKSIVEEKNEQIYGSIRYASTIQHAILPWESTLKKTFSEILILYYPKDIVSGDSYWFKEIDGIKLLAVIDCTGHGIPGAMLTVIASTALDDAVLGKRLSDTAQILTYMNEKVTEVLNQKLAENKIRDGMEVALIAIHHDKIQFSGAGRPLYLKNGSFEILKTDRRGIAGRAEDDNYIYSSVEIGRNCNLMLYLTTDGYADQMNEEGKKYSTRRLASMLETISLKPISEQQQLLEQELTKHQGGRNQIDDITIVGVKL
jgi:tetratricopeptide (TPR) repeat protein